MGPAARREDRPYDVVLFGATGFTGRLTAEWLAAEGPEDLSWALAGRNETRLRQARDQIAGLGKAGTTVDAFGQSGPQPLVPKSPALAGSKTIP